MSTKRNFADVIRAEMAADPKLAAEIKREQAIQYALAKLRHLYKQMRAGQVTDTAAAARGLLGPAIEEIERA